MTTAPVRARWAAFLQKIEGAYTDLMAEATVGCLAVLEANTLEPTAMSNAWNGIRAEIFALTERIGTTWREKVEAAFESAGAAPAELLEQEAVGRALGQKLMFELEKTEIELYADAATVILSSASAVLQRSFHCTQCNAQLPVPSKIFRSVHVTCEFCRSVNTFEPGSQVRMIEHFCAHHLSHRAAHGAWLDLKHTERERRETRGDTIENLRALESATRMYWASYFTARATLVPDLEKDFEKDLQGRMRGFELDMADNSVWLAARRSA